MPWSRPMTFAPSSSTGSPLTPLASVPGSIASTACFQSDTRPFHTGAAHVDTRPFHTGAAYVDTRPFHTGAAYSVAMLGPGTPVKFVLVGLSHKTAPVEIRVQVFIPEAGVGEGVRRLIDRDLIESGMVLSTCSRTELYAVAASAEATPGRLLESFGLW